MKHKIVIVGCGPGGLDYLTPAARREIEQADVRVGAKRLLDTFPESRAERVVVGSDLDAGLNRIAARRGRRVVVLVTGDPGLCSFAKPVLRRFGRSACRILPGISSVQTAFARVGVDWLDARIVNAHNRVPDCAPESLAGVRKIAVLAGCPKARRWLAGLAAVLGGRYRIFVCDNLTLPDERIREMRPAVLRTLKPAAHRVILWIHKEALS